MKPLTITCRHPLCDRPAILLVAEDVTEEDLSDVKDEYILCKEHQKQLFEYINEPTDPIF